MSTFSIKNLVVYKFFSARPRLVASIIIGFFTAFFVPEYLIDQSMTRTLIGWNMGVLVYLVTKAQMIFTSDNEQINRRAVKQNEGKFLILVLVFFSVFFTIGAIISQLSIVKHLDGSQKMAHIVLTSITILLSWFMTQTIFALQYAHDYYISKRKTGTGGLIFPNEEFPDYIDFLYFSFVIGTSGQTADVDFSSKSMRRLGLIHCILAYFFNTTLIALTINIAASLI